MTYSNDDKTHWCKLGKGNQKLSHFDDLLAEQYRRVHLGLLSRWIDINSEQKILKTDLFAEALQPSRAFLWDMIAVDANVIGIDISSSLTARAKIEEKVYVAGSTAEYVNCDVRQLPFASDSFDLIVSDSTLDHFTEKEDIFVALAELSRILKPGGNLVITMDNKGNITEPLFRLWIYLGLSDFYIGKTYSIGELKEALRNVGLSVVDTTAIIHNPRFFVRRAVSLLHKGNNTRFNKWIRKVLDIFDSLEKSRFNYLTAQFIAAKAVKAGENIAQSSNDCEVK
jgi:ubiquinone/menaquinone biosynthesis C-methylase UbiE